MDGRLPLLVDVANVLPVLAPDVKPADTTIRSTFATENGSSARTARSSRAGRSKILRLPVLGAGPRAAPAVPSPPQSPRLPAVRATARGSDETAHAAAFDPDWCCDSSGRRANDATVEPPLGTRRCSSGPADKTVQTVVRTLSASNSAAEVAASNCSATPLARRRILMDAESGPREGDSRTVKSRGGAANSATRRF